MTEGLVRGEGFATDASIIKADAQRQRGKPGDEAIDWGDPEEASRPVREYLLALEAENDPGAPAKAQLTKHESTPWHASMK